MRGPRPKPTRLREIEGNPGHRRYNRSEPRFAPAAVEDCPAWLNGVAQAEWRRLAPDMIRLGLLSKADVIAFAGYCLAVSHVVECELRIARAGKSPEAVSPAAAGDGGHAAGLPDATAVKAPPNVMEFPGPGVSGPGGKGKRGKRGKRGAAAGSSAAGGSGEDGAGEGRLPTTAEIDRLIDLTSASDGLTILDRNGVLRRSPYVQTLTQMLDKVRQYASEFGLTPSARGRIELADVAAAAESGAGDRDTVDGDASEEDLIAELEQIKREEKQIRRTIEAGSARRAKGAGRKGAKAPRATVH